LFPCRGAAAERLPFLFSNSLKLLHDHEVEGDRSQCSNALSSGKPRRLSATRSYIAMIKNKIFFVYKEHTCINPHNIFSNNRIYLLSKLKNHFVALKEYDIYEEFNTC
jgi:hypothetical protein